MISPVLGPMKISSTPTTIARDSARLTRKSRMAFVTWSDCM